MALLEVIVALTILVIAGVSAAVWTREMQAAVGRVCGSAEEVRSASNYLDVIALWPREDLDRHLGGRREGRWTVRVDRPSDTIYDVMVLDSSGVRTLLRTSLYRARESHAGS